MKRSLCALALLAGATIPAMGADPDLAEVYKFPLKDTLEASIYRGHIVFNHYCVLCHGVNADGNGKAAKIHNPRPANLLTSDKNDDYKELIIRRGGAALGRSDHMPPWGEELTNEQITDVVAFLHSIGQRKP